MNYKLPKGVNFGKANNEIEKILSQNYDILNNSKKEEYTKILKIVEKRKINVEKELDLLNQIEIPFVENVDIKPEDFDEYAIGLLKELDETIPEAFVENIKRKKEEQIKIKELEEKDMDVEIKKANKKGIISKISSIKQLWMNIFNDRSYYNELPGEIMFHALFGQIMRNKVFYKGNKPINLKCHFFWCQESGSGKGEGVDVLADTIKELNKIISKRYAKTHELKTIALGEFKGTETDATLLTHYAYKNDKRKGYNFENSVQGEFEINDFYVYREARVLLQREKYREQTATYFLDILEDTPIIKNLEGWSGNKTVTHAQGSLVATTVPLNSMSVFIANTGLIQRTLTCMRLLDRHTRKKMANKDALISGQQQTVSKKNREIYETNIKKIAVKVLDIYDNYKNVDLKIRNTDEISSFILKKMDELNNRIDLELRKKEYKSIARSFVGRYPLYIMKLMYQNCMLRNSEYVELEDVASAFKLIMKSYTYLENWLQDTLKVDKKRMENQISIIRIVNKEISMRKKKIVRFNDVVRALITKGYMSKDRAILILKDELTYGPRSLFVILKKGNEKFISKRGNIYDHDVYKNLTDAEF